MLLQPVKPYYRTPPSSNIQFLATMECCGVFFLFFFCIFFMVHLFFQLNNSFSFFCQFRSIFFFISTEMWYPKIWICCWDWWLLKGHFLYGSTPSTQMLRIHWILQVIRILNPIFKTLDPDPAKIWPNIEKEMPYRTFVTKKIFSHKIWVWYFWSIFCVFKNPDQDFYYPNPGGRKVPDS